MEWVEENRREWLYPLELARVSLAERPYYLAYSGFRELGDRCDVLGNLLAIVLGVANENRRARILEQFPRSRHRSAISCEGGSSRSPDRGARLA